MTTAAGTRLGRYEILAFLGVGGMGGVWRARDTRYFMIKDDPADSGPARVERRRGRANSLRPSRPRTSSTRCRPAARRRERRR